MTARVLVVDDIQANVDLLKAKLESRYFQVDTALDGPLAIKAAHSLLPDVILLDVMMPGLDGFQVCRALKSDPVTAHIPIVMVTALDERDYRLRGLEAGADDFLTKPANDTTLFARVKSLARLKQMMDEWRARLSTIQDLGIDVPESEAGVPDSPGIVAVAEADRLERDKIIGALHADGHRTLALQGLLDDPAAAGTCVADVFVVGLHSDVRAGLRLISAIRTGSATRYLPILLAAPEEATEAIADALELGANDYLLKPVEEAELCARLRTQLRRRRYQVLLGTHYQDGLKLALVDELTGLHNRRYLLSHLGRLLTESSERDKPIAAAMIDIDHFKRINDEMGHAFGDDVLRGLAGRVVGQLRPSDTLARLGGEEFVVIMPETTGAEAHEVAERLRMKVAEAAIPVPDGRSAAITVSCGIACAGPGRQDADTLLQAADRALYRAKENGRNQTAAATTLD